MKTFEPNKTTKELGIDTSRKFILLEPDYRSIEDAFKKGDILEFIDRKEYDGRCPFMKRMSDGKEDVFYWKELAYYEENKFKVGDKVRIKSKSLCGSLEDSATYKNGKGIGYITEIIGDGSGRNPWNCLVVSEKQIKNTGDFFAPQDLELIEEEIKAGDMVRIKDNAKELCERDGLVWEGDYCESKRNMVGKVYKVNEIIDDECYIHTKDKSVLWCFPKDAVEKVDEDLAIHTHIDIDNGIVNMSLEEYHKLTKKLIKGESQSNKLTNNIMSKALKFIKDATLSSDEKLLRKYDMKDNEGNYTRDFIEAVAELEAKERGYKSLDDMADKLGVPDNATVLTDAFYFEELSKKHLPTIIENLKKLDKEDK